MNLNVILCHVFKLLVRIYTENLINFQVYFAGLNNTDVKKAIGVYPAKHEDGRNSYGMDFSGVTDRYENLRKLLLNDH